MPASPAATSAASAPVTAKAAASPEAKTRVEPTGRVAYALDFGLAPAWLDPQENPALITPYALQYAYHDALVRHMPGKPFSPSLAESYEIAPDFKSATFQLRNGVKFHNGEPVTPEDVKFTFEKYRGANAKILHDKTERIDLVDNRTIRFVFKEPFLDFEVLYGSPASGAGWVVPKKYYEQVGADGFKQRPIGAGAYKFVQSSADAWEFEAFTDYWRKTPAVKTLVLKSVVETSTRVAQLQTGEVDFIHSVPGPLLETVQKDANLRLAPVLSVVFWLEFPGFEKPDNPFHDKRVREAVSLALDQKAISDAETNGLFFLPVGNWIATDWPGAIKGPEPKHDPVRAQQLLAEAGFPNGFEVPELTPLPPFEPVGERVIGQLREIGIRTKLNSMERGVFFQKLTEGPDAFKGIVLNTSGAPGDAASRIRAFAICKGSASRICVPEIDEKFAQYEKSTDRIERERLLTEVQQSMIENHIFPPVYRRVAFTGVGPRVANKPDEVVGAIRQFVTVGPYEDILLT